MFKENFIKKKTKTKTNKKYKMLTITDISVTADGNIQKSIYLEMNFSNGSNLSHYELQMEEKNDFLNCSSFSRVSLAAGIQ